MLKNYIKIAFRNIVKNKVHAFINIAGLSVGMAVAMLIGLWVWDELSFDKYHSTYNRMGQIMVNQVSNGETITFRSTVVPLSADLRTRYGSNFKHLSLFWSAAHILAVGDKKITQTGGWAEADMPAMLALKMVKGSYTDFKDPSSMIISQSVAKALFGDADPLNKTIKADNKTNLKVIGVYEDLPRNTSFYETRFLMPFFNKNNWWSTQTAAWDNHGCSLYVQLADNAEFDKVSAKISNVTKAHFKSYDETIQVHPMSKWHLYGDFKNRKPVGGRIEMVWLFGIIGVFVLLLACINFMNLSTARSEKRAKEVGIRKSIGSLRSQLVNQFLSESVVFSCLALLATFGIILIALPLFNHIADKQISLPWGNAWFWLMVLSFTLFTGIVAGSYPAFYLSSFEPVKVLKGTFKVGRFASLPRKVLVVVQFTVSITLIIGTIVVFRQIQYAKNRPVGYSRAGLLTFEMNTPEIYGHYEAMRNDLIQTGAVEDMAESNSTTNEIWARNGGFEWEGKDPKFEPTFASIAITYDYGHTVGWKIAQGRDFSRDFPTDTGAFIMNESAVKMSGIKNPVGKVIRWNKQDHVVTGVVKDMVMESPYNKPVASIFMMIPGWVNFITLRVKPTMPMQEALKKIEPVFKKYNPGSPFDFKFNDDEYASKFSDEQRIGNLATIFAVLAIFISCLGLFGLASFVAEQRIKEIGVRKVLGASVANLWRLLSTEFVVLVTISLFIAIPAAYYYMSSWLLKYEYRSTITWWIFAASGVGAVVITLLTVSYHAVKAALANPVKNLRSE